MFFSQPGRVLGFFLFPIFLFSILLEPLYAEDGRNHPVFILKIIVERGEIYSKEEAESTRLFRMLNTVNWLTRENTIRQELLFQEGDLLDAELVAETERNLRAIKGLSVAEVLIEPSHPGGVDIRVRTRDAFTLRIEASTSFVGGEAAGRLSLGESNLFGYGSSFSFVQTRRTKKSVNRIQYFEPRLFGSRQSFFTRYAKGDLKTNGHKISTVYYQFEVARPFFRLDTRHAYSIGYVFDDGADTFYDGDIDETTDVLRKKTGTSLVFSKRWGTRFYKHILTSTVRYQKIRYGEQFGNGKRTILVPDDAEFYSWVESYGQRKTHYFLEQEQLDTLEGVEDIEVGWEAGFSLGPGYRDKNKEGGIYTLIHGFNAQSVSIPTTDSVLVLHASALGRVNAGRYFGWEGKAFVHYYYQGFPWQTLVSSFIFDAVYEREDLERELILDEASGLRGYRAKAFSGNKRLRLNIEDRIFTPIEVYHVVFGFAAFLDSGYVWERGHTPDISDLRSSLGIGLRIGSLPLLKNTVLRVDMAFPLNSDDAAGFSISFRSGQIIQLLSNTEEGEEF